MALVTTLLTRADLVLLKLKRINYENKEAFKRL